MTTPLKRRWPSRLRGLGIDLRSTWRQINRISFATTRSGIHATCGMQRVLVNHHVSGLLAGRYDVFFCSLLLTRLFLIRHFAYLADTKRAQRESRPVRWRTTLSLYRAITRQYRHLPTNHDMVISSYWFGNCVLASFPWSSSRMDATNRMGPA